MKPPSGYPVLDNRPIDQWKVAELKEELKRRNLITRGLKEELVRRLDEDLRKEMEAEKQEDGNGDEEVATDDVIAIEETTGYETVGLGLGLGLGNPEIAVENVGDDDDGIVKLDDASGQVEIEDDIEQSVEGKGAEEQRLDLGSDHVSEEGTVATDDVPSTDLGNEISENLSSRKAGDGEVLQDGKMGRDDEGSRQQERFEDVKPLHEDGKLDLSDSNNQVSEVSSSLGFPVKSNSITTDNVSFNEKNELKDNIIADNVKLESDVKPVMVQPSSSDLVPDDGESHPSDVEEPLENKVSVQNTDNIVTDVDVSQKNYSADLGSSEKLNLDRSSGDESMEEDALESKHIDLNYNSEEVVEKTEKNEVTTLKEEIPVATMDIDVPANDKGIHHENSSVADASTDKRKLSDQETVSNNEPSKRQRKWKSESNSFKEPHISNISPQSAVKDVPQPAVLKRNLSGSKSKGGVDEPPKEREVPPSSKPATNSLRIDHFLRPFTLKAVQELLAKTGTVASFWMDHIKTHCYVTYSSVEEAVETRNAVYNLQWPPNGGRHLVAEFVNPEEVKARVDPTPPPPALTSSGPAVPETPKTMPQSSPRQQSLKQQMAQQPSLPPPPPLTNPPQARERALPPAPPQNEKVEAPIVTLDDLFRKTKATPRIYYLPLSEKQVSDVLETRSKNSTKQ